MIAPQPVENRSGEALTITSLELQGWRNLEALTLDPHPAFNVLYGDNAQGKTNLLEAVYLTGRLKSFRDARFSDLVTHGQSAARVAATVIRAGVTQSVEVRIEGGRRRVRIDGKGITRVSDHCRHYKVVLFTPEDIYLARGAPSERRRFLDRALYNLEPAFLADSLEYQRTLKRRNALLKGRMAPVDIEPSLAAYDDVLAQTGSRIVCRRQSLVQELHARLGDVWERVFGGEGRVDLEYQSTVPGPLDDTEATAQAFVERLKETRGFELERGATTTGPHRDDLVTLLDGRPLQTHASQGQHRVFVLALKVTEIQLVVERTAVRPILLLDDVSSELDRLRNAQLFEYLDEVRGQVFLTTTAPDLVGLTVDRAEFRVVAGKAWKSS